MVVRPASAQTQLFQQQTHELSKKFHVTPGSRVRLKDCDPDYSDPHEKKKASRKDVAKLQERMDALQFRLYAEGKRSLLIVL